MTTLADTAPRTGLIRTYTFHPSERRPVRAASWASRADDDGGAPTGETLVGYSILFDEVTRIDSWEGQFDEQVDPKATDRSLRSRTPVVQFDHGRHPMIGSLPIGTLDVAEADKRGLYTEATVLRSWLTDPLVEAVRQRTIGGWSFRFDVIEDKWDFSGDVPMRTLLDVEIYELGPVVFPAYESTDISLRGVDLTGVSHQELATAVQAVSGASDGSRARTDERPVPKVGTVTAAERLRWGQFATKENNA